MLEGLGYQSRLIIETIERLSQVRPTSEIRLIGGGTHNLLVRAMETDVVGHPLAAMSETETLVRGSALKAALPGGIATGAGPTLRPLPCQPLCRRATWLPGRQQRVVWRGTLLSPVFTPRLFLSTKAAAPSRAERMKGSVQV